MDNNHGIMVGGEVCIDISDNAVAGVLPSVWEEDVIQGIVPWSLPGGAMFSPDCSKGEQMRVGLLLESIHSQKIVCGRKS